VDSLELHGLVLGSTARLPHKLVLGEIPVAKVEFDLGGVSKSAIQSA
jgi:hypothetical protein